MKLTKAFWEFLKKAAPAIGRPDDVGLGFLDDESAVVTVQYVLTEKQWESLEAKWKAQAGTQ